MLVYDGSSARATRKAERLQPLLPVGYPVVAVADLPEAGTLRLDRRAVRGTVAWVDADGTVHPGHAGVAHALIACGGRPALRGWLMRAPLLGRLLPT